MKNLFLAFVAVALFACGNSKPKEAEEVKSEACDSTTVVVSDTVNKTCCDSTAKTCCDSTAKTCCDTIATDTTAAE